MNVLAFVLVFAQNYQAHGPLQVFISDLYVNMC